MSKVLFDAMTGEVVSGPHPVILQLQSDAGSMTFVKRDDGRINVQLPNGSVEVLTREELLEPIEGKDDEGARSLRAWLDIPATASVVPGKLQ